MGLIVWPLGLFLEALILGRMLYSRNFKRQPIFYLYLLSVFLVSGVLYLMYWKADNHHIDYSNWYWQTQLVTLVIGYGVILDFARRSFTDYPGADRFFRTLGFAIFLCTFGLVGYHLLAVRSLSLNAFYDDLEKYLRVVEALFLVATLLVLSYFGIRVGRNLTGIVLGMGLYVAVSLALLAVIKYAGPGVYAFWEFMQSATYLAALAIWTVALWSPDSAPRPPSGPPGSGNYDQLTDRTRAELESLRDYFGSGAQS
jgi:hypothetical protein